MQEKSQGLSFTYNFKELNQSAAPPAKGVKNLLGDAPHPRRAPSHHPIIPVHLGSFKMNCCLITFLAEKRCAHLRDTRVLSPVFVSHRGEKPFSPDQMITPLKLWGIKTGTCIKTIPLLWRPFEIQFQPGSPGLFATANGNCTVTFFDIREILEAGMLPGDSN